MRYRCDEPHGTVWRSVQKLSPHPAGVLKVYDRLKKVPNLFTFKEPVTPEVLERLFARHGFIWTVDDVGIILIVPFNGIGAHAHITFWDGRLRGREDLCRRFALDRIRDWSLQFITTPVPREHVMIAAFVKRVGFEPLLEKDGLVFWSATAEDLQRVKPSKRLA